MHPMAYRLHTFTPPSPCPQVSTPNPSAPASRTPRGSWSVVPSRRKRASATCRTLAPPSTTSWVPDEKLHAVVAQSTFWSHSVQNTPCPDHFWKLRCHKKVHTVVARRKNSSQNVQNTAFSDHFWKLRCWKSARPCGAKHIQGKMLKTPHARTTFGRSDVVLRGRRKGLCTLSLRAKRGGFLACPQTMAGLGHVKRIWKDAFSVAGAIQETCSSEMLGGRSAEKPEKRCVLEHQIFSVGKMILFDTGAALRMTLASLFRGRRNTLDTWTRRNAKRNGTRPSALRSTFHFWRKSCKIASFLDVVNVENWGSLAE